MKQNMRRFYLYLALVLVLPLQQVVGQIKVSEVVQYSKTATSNDNALYLIDFWATWCGPCIHAKKYLGSLQKQYPEGFYILSLSEENPTKVKRFMQKNATNLAVAIDYDGETFSKYVGQTLPHSTLFNAKGKVLWEGHPADLKPYDVKRFLSQNKSTISIDKFIKVLGDGSEETVVSSYIPTEDFELKPLKGFQEDIQITEANGYLKMVGDLKSILSYTSNVYEKQIVIPQELNKSYELFVKKDSGSYENISEALMNELKLEYTEQLSKGKALVLSVENPTFWDTAQINWGSKSPSFLVGDSDIKADDVSLFEVSSVLAKAIEMPVVIASSDVDISKKHDWEIHFKFFDLMKGGLMDNYGIKAEKKETSYTIFNVTKKAP